MKPLLLAAALLMGASGLSGCVTDAELADNQCQSYGAQPGSDIYVACRMIKGEQLERERQEASDALIEEGLKKATTGYW